MTRVNDALTRAKSAEGVPASPDMAGTGIGNLLPEDTAADLWMTEPETAAQPGPLPREIEVVDDGHAGEKLRETLTFEGLERRSAGKLVLNAELEPTSVEQYRRVAARLHMAQAQQGTRVVMVTSALVGEGKTLTATNLALTLSESYKKRVLLIDADLRRPGVHEMFRVPNFTGLNDGIRSDEDRKVPVIRITNYLSVLTAGRPDPDPMSVLSSERMRRVVSDAAAAFDWVIIDTPPVGLLSDAHLLATLVDTVILVVRAGVTPLQAIQTATQSVGRDRIMGVVLNCAAGAPANVYHYHTQRVAEAATAAK